MVLKSHRWTLSVAWALIRKSQRLWLPLQKHAKTKKTSQDNFVDLFYSALKNANPNVKLAPISLHRARKAVLVYPMMMTKYWNYWKMKCRAPSIALSLFWKLVLISSVHHPKHSTTARQWPHSNRNSGADNPQRVRKLRRCCSTRILECGWSLRPIAFTLIRCHQPTVAERKSHHCVDYSKTTTNDIKRHHHIRIGEAVDHIENSLSNSLDSLRNAGNSPLYALMTPGSQFMYSIKDTATINSIFRRPEIRTCCLAMLPSSGMLNPAITWPRNVKDDLTLNFCTYGYGAKPLLTGETIVDARLDYDQYARPSVSMRMNAAGSKSARSPHKLPRYNLKAALPLYWTILFILLPPYKAKSRTAARRSLEVLQLKKPKT